MVIMAIVIILVMVGDGNDGVDICINVCVYELEFLLSR